MFVLSLMEMVLMKIGSSIIRDILYYLFVIGSMCGIVFAYVE